MLNVFSETQADILVYLLVQTEKYLFTNHCNSFLGLFLLYNMSHVSTHML